MVRGEKVTSRNGIESITKKPKHKEGGRMIEQFIKDLAFCFDRLKQRHEKMDFPKGLLYYEYPVQCNGKFLRLGVEIESGKFYLQGDGIDGKPKTILL
jgi:hypothetical protein